MYVRVQGATKHVYSYIHNPYAQSIVLVTFLFQLLDVPVYYVCTGT